MSYAYDMPAAQRTATAELASALRMGVMRLARRLRSERADTGLSLTQLTTLASLERLGPTSPGVLAAQEKVRPPSMTRVLAGLEELELVFRTDHPTDGRQVVVSITESARRLLQEDRQRREAWLAQRLTELSADERATLRRASVILDRLATS